MKEDERHGLAAENLHIFINRRKYEAGDGVKPVLTGRDIAGLAKVPAENATIRRETGPEQYVEIGLDESVALKQAEHFLVIRRNVDGGSCD